jgi:hypothetical protein
MKRYTKGIVLKGEATDITENLEGSLFQNSADLRLKAYIEGAVRQIVTNTQSQVLTNKTIDVDNNSVSNIQTSNLKSGVLNTSTTLSGASNTQLPSALAVKTYIDDKAAAQNEASEISFTPVGTIAATTVQAMGQELDGDIQAHTTASTDVHGIGVGNSVVGTGTSQALTNKTIDADLNTISNIDNADIKVGAAIDAAKIADGSVSNAEFQYLGSVTSDIQTQLNAKVNASGGTLTNGSVVTPIRSDVKQDTKANLTTYATTAANGQLVFATDTKEYLAVKDGILDSIGGGGSSGINYIGNFNFEANATGWSTYADAASSVPVDGTGGSPLSTFVRTTTTPLRGTGSGLLSKPASNEQGEGFSFPFTIDPADQAQVLRISFDHSSTVNYVGGDVRVYIFDVTNSTIIEVIDRDIPATTQGKYVGTFQTSSNSTSYRLIFHIATVSALAYDLEIDNVVVGPQTLIKGAVVTDWQSFTPTGTWTTGTWTGNYRRVGDQLGVTGRFTTSTAPTGSFNINLPFGLSVDTAKLQSSLTSLTPLGQANLYDVSTGTNYIGEIRTDSATQLRVYILTTSGSNQTSNTLGPASPITIAVNDRVDFNFSVPVVGWSSNLTLSEDSGNRLIAAFKGASLATGTPSGASSTVVFPAMVKDTTASYNSGLYTVPETGFYDVKSSVEFLGTFSVGNDTSIFISLDSATTVHNFGYRSNVAESRIRLHANGIVHATKGQTISIRSITGGTGVSYAATMGGSSLSIAKISSPQTLAGSETVACRYISDAGQSVVNNSNIVYEDKVYDTHNAYNNSTGIWTCPSSGYYRFENSYETATYVGVVGTYLATSLINTSTSVSVYNNLVYIQTTANVPRVLSGSTTVYCAKGNTVVLRFTENIAAVNLSADALSNWMTITKVGN